MYYTYMSVVCGDEPEICMRKLVYTRAMGTLVCYGFRKVEHCIIVIIVRIITIILLYKYTLHFIYLYILFMGLKKKICQPCSVQVLCLMIVMHAARLVNDKNIE